MKQIKYSFPITSCTVQNFLQEKPKTTFDALYALRALIIKPNFVIRACTINLLNVIVSAMHSSTFHFYIPLRVQQFFLFIGWGCIKQRNSATWWLISPRYNQKVFPPSVGMTNSRHDQLFCLLFQLRLPSLYSNGTPTIPTLLNNQWLGIPQPT